MTYRQAKAIFRQEGGKADIDSGRSYQRDGAWHLLNFDAQLIGVVLANGECIYGDALSAWWRQFMRGAAG